MNDYKGDGTFLPSYFALDNDGNIILPDGSTPPEDVIYDLDGNAIGVKNKIEVEVPFVQLRQRNQNMDRCRLLKLVAMIILKFLRMLDLRRRNLQVSCKGLDRCYRLFRLDHDNLAANSNHKNHPILGSVRSCKKKKGK